MSKKDDAGGADAVNTGGKAGKFFAVLQTARECQTAMMTLRPGEASGPRSNEHPESEQVLLVLEGEVVAEIGEGRRTLRKDDVVIVPKKTAHRFANESGAPAVTFNVYDPPAYDEGEEQDGPE